MRFPLLTQMHQVLSHYREGIVHFFLEEEAILFILQQLARQGWSQVAQNLCSLMLISQGLPLSSHSAGKPLTWCHYKLSPITPYMVVIYLHSQANLKH